MRFGTNYHHLCEFTDVTDTKRQGTVREMQEITYFYCNFDSKSGVSAL